MTLKCTIIYLLKNISSIDHAVHNINVDLKVISQYSSTHRLMLNEKKTQMLILDPHRHLILMDPLKVKLNDFLLLPVNSCQNFGLHIDGDLRFGSHVNSLIQICFHKLKVLHICLKIFK